MLRLHSEWAFRLNATAAAASALMPLHQRRPQYFYDGNTSSMSSTGLIDPYAMYNSVSLPALTFAPTYDPLHTFAHASFGSLSYWALAPLATMPGPPAFNRTDIQSSSDSDMCIQTDEDWPTQTYQLFDDANTADSPPTGGSPVTSSNERKSTVFSTGIDTLLTTI